MFNNIEKTVHKILFNMGMMGEIYISKNMGSIVLRISLEIQYHRAIKLSLRIEITEVRKKMETFVWRSTVKDITSQVFVQNIVITVLLYLLPQKTHKYSPN